MKRRQDSFSRKVLIYLHFPLCSDFFSFGRIRPGCKKVVCVMNQVTARASS